MKKEYYAFFASSFILMILIFFVPEFFMPALKTAPATKYTEHYFLATIVMCCASFSLIVITTKKYIISLLYIMFSTILSPILHLVVVNDIELYFGIYLWMLILYFIPSIIILFLLKYILTSLRLFQEHNKQEERNTNPQAD